MSQTNDIASHTNHFRTACPGVLPLLLLALTAGPALAAVERTRGRVPAHRPSTVLVKFKERLTAEQVRAIVQQHGAHGAREFEVLPSLRHSPIERWQRVTLAPGQDVETARFRLGQDPAVEAAELDWVVSLSPIPTDPPPLGGRSFATSDPSVVVAVIDTGIDHGHSDLWTNLGEIPGNGVDDDGNGYVDDRHGYDFANDDADPSDDNGHGTRVAGIIAAEGNSRVMALKFAFANGSGWTSDAIDALLYATAMGAKVLNGGWGGGAYSEALRDAVAGVEGAGALVVAGAAAEDDNDRASSLAAPQVSGIAALVFSRFPSLTPGQVKHRLLYGGRLNAASALEEDVVPPDPTPLLEVAASRARTVSLAWTATGDDGSAGRASAYDLRYSTSPIDDGNFDSATPVAGVPAPSVAGAAETFEVRGLRPQTLYYFALKVVDNVGNASALSPVASTTTGAESIVFSDDMEGGPDNWTVAGSDGVGGPALWHLSTHRSGSPRTAFYYGRESTLNYDTGARNIGSIASPPIDLGGRRGSWLSFRHFLQTENFPWFDVARVYVSSDGGAHWTKIYENFAGTQNSMVEAGVDLSAYDRQVISLLFQFDSGDAFLNRYEGWVIDDVVVSSEAFPDHGLRLVVNLDSVESGVGYVRVSAPNTEEYCYGTAGTIQSCSYLFQPGTVVILDALPGSDSVFLGWFGGCSGPTPSCQVMVTDDLAVGAAFRGP